MKPKEMAVAKARRLWAPRSGHAERLPDGTVAQKNWIPCEPCPPEVVSALLDVLDEVFRADSCVSCFGHRVYKHRPGCLVEQAEDTIARALGEQKP